MNRLYIHLNSKILISISAGPYICMSLANRAFLISCSKDSARALYSELFLLANSGVYCRLSILSCDSSALGTEMGRKVSEFFIQNSSIVPCIPLMSVVGNSGDIVVNGGSGDGKGCASEAPGRFILPLTTGGSDPSNFLALTSLGNSS